MTTNYHTLSSTHNNRLKICYPKGFVGSSPTAGILFIIKRLYTIYHGMHPASQWWDFPVGLLNPWPAPCQSWRFWLGRVVAQAAS